MRFNLRKALLPPLVLYVYLAKVCHEKGIFGTGLVSCSQSRSPHDPIPELDVRVSITKRG
jgi:hypothetical protein